MTFWRQAQPAPAQPCPTLPPILLPGAAVSDVSRCCFPHAGRCPDGGRRTITGPHRRLEVNRYHYWQWELLTPQGAWYHHEVFFMPLMGHVPWFWKLFPVLGALITNNFVQHVLKVLVTFTVLPNSCFFLVWHAASHSGEKIIVWLNSWSVSYPTMVSLFENWWLISYIKDHQV